ncbi:hypothetical protein [Burkholderia latens]|uniref:hypothetical protein n=1 Tax=Burkholderia latens TaxID=488446 RepID=UPI001AE9C497|nr:hypothetical protein [Burkholderia latens]MBR7964595.1 hypothetical protein [Burkholderia vietnamiensis]QTO46956.1 hypothetical protein J8I85_25805 [Burkholderia latens]
MSAPILERRTDARFDGPENPHTGVSVANINFDPGEDELLKRYVEETLQNINYESLEHLTNRATNYFYHLESEKAIISDAREAVRDSNSALFRQSAHVAHLVRGLWSLVKLDEATRIKLGNELLARKSGPEGCLPTSVFDLLFEGAKELHAMIARREQGPLTLEQSQYGVELASGLTSIARRFRPPADLFDRVEQDMVLHRVSSNRGGTNHFQSTHGTDLSMDEGSMLRDRLGVSVMLGNSGTSADIALVTKLAATEMNQSMWAEGLSDEQGRLALIDALMYFMREQVVPISSQSAYDSTRARLGADPKNVDSFNVFSHSYSEISTAVHLALDGVCDVDTMRAQIDKDRERLASKKLIR